MELDDLKKSWNRLDEQLQKETIVDEKQIADLIAKYQANVAKGLNKVTNFQKTSLLTAISLLVLMVIVVLKDTAFLNELKLTTKVVSMFIYIMITVVFCLWWDLKTYRFSRNTKIAELSTLETMERMNTFAKWMNLEFKITPVWSIGFFALYYWLMDYHTKPLPAQIIFVLLSAIALTALMWFLHKTLFKHLNDIRKNLKEIIELRNY